MKKYKWLIILVNLIILLGLFNFSVIKKEQLRTDGKLILLKLAPVDPRSLMQGDYMRLRYDISNNIDYNDISKRGYVVVQLYENGIAEKVRIQDEKEPLYEGEYLIKYTTNGYSSINIGAESFFFQEGEADKYDNAKYGGIKVDNQGNSLLIGLYDQSLKKIE